MFAEEIKKRPDEKIVVRYADMKDFFLERAKGNPLIYTVFIKKASGMNFAITAINAGKIGKEFFMTRGHKHKKPYPELYIMLKGKGILFLKNKKERRIKMKKHDIYYVPADKAHRVINNGKSKLEFLSIYSSKAGHDYEAFKKCL